MHYLKRFKKASQCAKEMVKLSKDAVDDLTHVEMEAYECLMTAVYLIELFSFEEALNMLLKAKVIFEQLRGY